MLNQVFEMTSGPTLRALSLKLFERINQLRVSMRARAHLFAGFPSSPSDYFLRGEARVIRRARLTPDCACFISRVSLLVKHALLTPGHPQDSSLITGDCRARCETIKLWQKPTFETIEKRINNKSRDLPVSMQIFICPYGAAGSRGFAPIARLRTDTLADVHRTVRPSVERRTI